MKQKALGSGLISEGHARALLGLSSPQAQNAALQSVIKNELNVRQTEELVRKLSGVKPKIETKNRKITGGQSAGRTASQRPRNQGVFKFFLGKGGRSLFIIILKRNSKP